MVAQSAGIVRPSGPGIHNPAFRKQRLRQQNVIYRAGFEKATRARPRCRAGKVQFAHCSRALDPTLSGAISVGTAKRHVQVTANANPCVRKLLPEPRPFQALLGDNHRLSRPGGPDFVIRLFTHVGMPRPNRSEDHERPQRRLNQGGGASHRIFHPHRGHIVGTPDVHPVHAVSGVCSRFAGNAVHARKCNVGMRLCQNPDVGLLRLKKRLTVRIAISGDHALQIPGADPQAHPFPSSRATITRMISLVPSRIWFTRTSRTMRSIS